MFYLCLNLSLNKFMLLN